MAVHTKTIEYAFQSRNGAALASATRYDFTAITLYIPETTSRVFKSVRVRVFCRDAVTTATNLTSPLVGIKLGAVAFSDSTLGNPPGNSGENASYVFERDVTSYFTSNFGAGGSQTCQVGVSFTGPTTVNISAKLIITYECEDQQTRVKTVRIPLDSGLGALTATLAEIGTNQIPALDTFLPESSVVKRRVWFELHYNETTTGPTNDSSLGMQVDSETEHLSGIHESSLASSCFGMYFWDQTSATWVASGGGSVHAFKLRADTVTAASTFYHVGIILCVTYEYDHTNSTTILNSLILAMGYVGQAGATAETDAIAGRAELWIEEPASITQVQSGLLCMYHVTAAFTIDVKAGAGSERAYSDIAAAYCGISALTHRTDSGGAGGSAWTLARGLNRLQHEVRITSAATAPSDFQALLYLNYTSGKHASGDGVHNRTTIWNVQNSQTAANYFTIAAAQWVDIAESAWFRNDLAFIGMWNQAVAAAAFQTLYIEANSGELSEAYEHQETHGIFSDAELGVYPLIIKAKDEQWDRWASDPQTLRMDVEGSRRIRPFGSTSITGELLIMFTYHSITFAVAGSVSGSGGGALTVKAIRDVDTRREEVGAASRTGDGAFSATVYDSVDDMIASVREDATHVGRSEKAVAL